MEAAQKAVIRSWLIVLIAMAAGKKIFLYAKDGEPHIIDFPPLPRESFDFLIKEGYITWGKDVSFACDFFEITEAGRFIVSDHARRELKAFEETTFFTSSPLFVVPSEPKVEVVVLPARCPSPGLTLVIPKNSKFYTPPVGEEKFDD